MSKRDRSSDTLPLLEAIERASAPKLPSCHVDSALRAALVGALRDSPNSRFQVAAHMSEMLDADVSKFMLDAWTASSKEGHRFPAAYLPAFCRSVDSIAPLEVIARASGVSVFASRERLLAEKASLDLRARELRSKSRRIGEALKMLEDA